LPQERDCRHRVHDDQWASRVALGIPGHQRVAPGGLRGGCADSVLEIPPSQAQRATENGPIHRGYTGYGHEIADHPAREGGIALAGGQIEDLRDPVSGDEDLDLLPLRGGPEEACRLAEWRPVENEIEDYVDVQKEPLQRYFRSR
jgi:hypothetical protein